MQKMFYNQIFFLYIYIYIYICIYDGEKNRLPQPRFLESMFK